MLITFEKDQAIDLTGIVEAASTDKGRPVLCSFNLEFEVADDDGSVEVLFVTTDSYKLIVKRAVLGHAAGGPVEGEPWSGYFIPEDDDGLDQKGKLLIGDTKAVMKAVKEAASAIKVGDDRVVIAVGAEEIVVTTSSQHVAYTFPVTTEYDFPTWRQLLPEDHKAWLFDGEDPKDPEVIDLPAFNADYLARLLRGLAGPPSRTKAAVPVRVLAGRDSLKPWGFGWSARGRLRAYGLLMPVRL